MTKLKIKSTAKFMHELHNAVILHKQKTFYDSLPQVGVNKKLAGKRIQKTGAHNK